MVSTTACLSDFVLLLRVNILNAGLLQIAKAEANISIRIETNIPAYIQFAAEMHDIYT